MTNAGWYVARRLPRQQRLAVLALAVAVAIVVAAVLACASTARRSHTALDRLQDRSNASDETLFATDLELAKLDAGVHAATKRRAREGTLRAVHAAIAADAAAFEALLG